MSDAREVLERGGKRMVSWGALVKLMREVGDVTRKWNEQRDAKIASLEQRLAKSQAALDSAERRLSRHAEHLAKLETKLQALRGER